MDTTISNDISSNAKAYVLKYIRGKASKDKADKIEPSERSELESIQQFLHTHTFIYTYIFVHIFIYTYIYICTNTFIYTYIFVQTHTHMHIYIYICTNTHTRHIHILVDAKISERYRLMEDSLKPQ